MTCNHNNIDQTIVWSKTISDKMSSNKNASNIVINLPRCMKHGLIVTQFHMKFAFIVLFIIILLWSSLYAKLVVYCLCMLPTWGTVYVFQVI